MNEIKPMYIIIDSETRHLVMEPACHNVNLIFDKLVDAENYQRNISGPLKGKTEILIKYPQFLNMFEVQQLERSTKDLTHKPVK